MRPRRRASSWSSSSGQGGCPPTASYVSRITNCDWSPQGSPNNRARRLAPSAIRRRPGASNARRKAPHGRFTFTDCCSLSPQPVGSTLSACRKTSTSPRVARAPSRSRMPRGASDRSQAIPRRRMLRTTACGTSAPATTRTSAVPQLASAASNEAASRSQPRGTTTDSMAPSSRVVAIDQAIWDTRRYDRLCALRLCRCFVRVLCQWWLRSARPGAAVVAKIGHHIPGACARSSGERLSLSPPRRRST